MSRFEQFRVGVQADATAARLLPEEYRAICEVDRNRAIAGISLDAVSVDVYDLAITSYKIVTTVASTRGLAPELGTALAKNAFLPVTLYGESLMQGGTPNPSSHELARAAWDAAPYAPVFIGSAFQAGVAMHSCLRRW